MNHFMARLIFCFFAEDTDIFRNTDVFTKTVEQMSEKELSRLGTEAAKRAAQLHAWPRVFERLFCIYREVCANYKGNAAA